MFLVKFLKIRTWFSRRHHTQCNLLSSANNSLCSPGLVPRSDRSSLQSPPSCKCPDSGSPGRHAPVLWAVRSWTSYESCVAFVFPLGRRFPVRVARYRCRTCRACQLQGAKTSVCCAQMKGKDEIWQQNACSVALFSQMTDHHGQQNAVRCMRIILTATHLILCFKVSFRFVPRNTSVWIWVQNIVKSGDMISLLLHISY